MTKTIAYIDPSSLGHRIPLLALHLKVCASAGLRLRTYVPERLWRAGCEVAGSAADCGEHALDLEVEGLLSFRENKRVLDAAADDASSRNVALYYFPFLDAFTIPLLHRRLCRRPLSAPWSGLFFMDGFNYLTGDLLYPKRLARSLLFWPALCLAAGGGAREIVTLNRGWRRWMPVPVVWMPDTMSRVGDAFKALTHHDGAAWPVPHPDGLANGRVRFLIFGSMTPRKGVREAARAFLALTNEELGRVELRLLGKFDDPTFKTEVTALFEDLRRHGADVELVDAFVSDEVIDQALRRCDFVLAPYQRHMGSSGLMEFAAAYGRPVLTQKDYQIGAEVRRYGIGLAVDCAKPDRITAALRLMMAGKVKASKGMVKYTSEGSPDRSLAVMRETFLRITDNR